MADKNVLGMIGLMLCAATVLVTMVGVIVVNSQLTGQLQTDDNSPAAVVLLPAAR